MYGLWAYLKLFQRFEPFFEARILFRSGSASRWKVGSGSASNKNIRIRIRIRITIRLRVKSRIRISIRLYIKVMRIHNTGIECLGMQMKARYSSEASHPYHNAAQCAKHRYQYEPCIKCRVADPDPDYFWSRWMRIRMRAKSQYWEASLEAQSGAVVGCGHSQWRRGGS